MHTKYYCSCDLLYCSSQREAARPSYNPVIFGDLASRLVAGPLGLEINYMDYESCYTMTLLIGMIGMIE